MALFEKIVDDSSSEVVVDLIGAIMVHDVIFSSDIVMSDSANTVGGTKILPLSSLVSVKDYANAELVPYSVPASETAIRSKWVPKKWAFSSVKAEEPVRRH
jgi:hypothetical protein